MEEFEETTPEDDRRARRRQDLKKYLGAFFDFTKTLLLIIVLTYSIRIFVIQPYIVEGQSMEPTFSNNDYLVTEKVLFKMRAPQRGEVVIFHPPENPEINYIKRVVGLPGETVAIREGGVHINGRKILEPYLVSKDTTALSRGKEYTATLGSDEYFLMGDNRNHSRDSREIGAIPLQNIVSRTWFRLLPLDKIRAFAAIQYETNE